ncbi:MAG: 16S rRNA (cytosine(1402)-N(4))-methyltransferase RsmH [Clostridiales bacterium]|nr:16S rRNA (cytosine(1402)-N(4))-methyltransferase RsmH [Clostridiales bacterium]
MDKNFDHTPVLFEECIENLKIIPSGTYIDCTVGGGGHSAEILKRLGDGGYLICMDQDEDALAAAEKKLKQVRSSGSFHIIDTNFVNLIEVCKGLKINNVSGILFDLGVSSYQFDTQERGFSYNFDSKLDMRMDKNAELTGLKIVNEYSQQDLIRIIRDYGEENWAARIAAFIVEERKKIPIETTFQLVDIIKAAIPVKARREGPHPARRTFQAIRIETNRELEVLEKAVDDAIEILEPGGRLCIISFHSLEDRIVKNKFKIAANPCECPASFPVCVCGKKARGKVITTKPITPKESELENNPRSRSAKLRVFEKFQ